MKDKLFQIRPSYCIIAIMLFAISFFDTVRAQNFEREDVHITTPAGYEIVGTYYSMPGTKGPAILLLPNILGKRADWNDFIPILKDSGIKSILAIDLPGTEASNIKNNEKISWRGFSEKDFNDIATELNAAWSQLKKAPSTDTAHMGILGSLLGANYAAVLASNNPDVKSLVLLSPGLVYRGVASFWAMEKYPDKAVLLVATKTDYYSAQSCEKIKEGKGANVQFQLYDKPAYGTDILANNPSFKTFLANWLKSNL